MFLFMSYCALEVELCLLLPNQWLIAVTGGNFDFTRTDAESISSFFHSGLKEPQALFYLSTQSFNRAFS